MGRSRSPVIEHDNGEGQQEPHIPAIPLPMKNIMNNIKSSHFKNS